MVLSRKNMQKCFLFFRLKIKLSPKYKKQKLRHSCLLCNGLMAHPAGLGISLPKLKIIFETTSLEHVSHSVIVIRPRSPKIIFSEIAPLVFTLLVLQLQGWVQVFRNGGGGGGGGSGQLLKHVASGGKNCGKSGGYKISFFFLFFSPRIIEKKENCENVGGGGGNVHSGQECTSPPLHRQARTKMHIPVSSTRCPEIV